MPPAAITKLARVFPLKKARAITAKSAAALKPLDTLNVRAILLLWLLVLMSGAALLNASAATAEANEGKHTTILAMRKLSDRVELEMVPVKPKPKPVPEYVVSSLVSVLESQSPGLEDSGEYLPRPDGKVHSDFYSTVLPEEDPDFYTIRQKREEDLARGFAALSIGWNNESAEDNKQFRQDAVNAFGEEWVADWEKQSPVTQMEIAGKRFLTEYYTLEGDKGHEALTRYNKANKEDIEKDISLYALSEDDVWRGIQKKGKEWYAGEAAKRKAEKKAKKAGEEEEARLRSEEEYKKEKLNNTILTVSLSVIGVIVGACPLFLLCKASRRWNYEQWAAALAVVLLVLAVADSATFPRWLDLPYGFYLLLRVIVAVLSAWQAARALMEKRHPLLFLLPACLCLIYQPLVKIPFERETWLWLNAASVFVLIIGARRKKNDAGNDA